MCMFQGTPSEKCYFLFDAEMHGLIQKDNVPEMFSAEKPNPVHLCQKNPLKIEGHLLYIFLVTDRELCNRLV